MTDLLTESDRETLTSLALDALGDPDAPLFLAGSMADGLANDGSDYDLYTLGTTTVDGSETAARKAERTATIAYHRGREVNLAVIDPTALAAVRDAFTLARASLSSPTGIAQVVDDDEVKLLHRIRTGIALRGADRLAALRIEHRTDDLSRYLFNREAVAAVNRLTDVAGELAAGHHDSAAWMHREALIHTGHCVLAAAGVTVTAPKWLVRLLGDTPGAEAAHVLAHLLHPSTDPAAAVRATGGHLAALIDAAGDLAGPYVRTVARPKLG